MSSLIFFFAGSQNNDTKKQVCKQFHINISMVDNYFVENVAIVLHITLKHWRRQGICYSSARTNVD